MGFSLVAMCCITSCVLQCVASHHVCCSVLQYMCSHHVSCVTSCVLQCVASDYVCCSVLHHIMCVAVCCIKTCMLQCVASHHVCCSVFQYTCSHHASCLTSCVLQCVASHLVRCSVLHHIICVALCLFKSCVTRHIMCVATCVNWYCHTTLSAENAIGWLRSVGSIKLQVSFAEYCLFYRALLQKRPIIVSILLTKATPYAPDIHQIEKLKFLGSHSNYTTVTIPSWILTARYRDICHAQLSHLCMADSTEISTLPKSTRSRNSDFSVQI